MRTILIVFFATLIASCTPKEPLYNTQSYVFGTLVDISIFGETEIRAQQISSEIFGIFQTLHTRLHAWQPSELKTLNDAFAKGKAPIKVNDDIAQMIRHATQLYIQSNGKFNPAIGRLINTWGFQQNEFKAQAINKKKIKKLVTAQAKMTDIVIENNMVYSNNTSVQLDLGGYAKGYALDIAIQHLKKRGVKHALINIGGNIIALGQHGKKPWHVGIQHPRKPNAIATLDLASGWAIGTSGDYQRYFMLDGQRYCHIIDPDSGYPSSGTQSVTILIPPQTQAGVLSDVASKPIFIATNNARLQAANAMQINQFLIIESKKNILISPAMSERIHWIDNDAKKNAMILYERMQ